VLTEIGPVEIDVPRDTGSTFDPQIVRKRQRRLAGVEGSRALKPREGLACH
jgi:putative transposase